jgi:hypothetical protein
MEEEFDFDKIKITKDMSRARKAQHKGELFAKLWLWHLHLLLEKRAGGNGSLPCS